MTYMLKVLNILLLQTQQEKNNYYYHYYDHKTQPATDTVVRKVTGIYIYIYI